MAVVASATNVEQAMANWSGCSPDITLMDLQLPGINGVEGSADPQCRADARIVVLTMYQGDEDIYRSLEAGAATYVLKDTLSDELVPYPAGARGQQARDRGCGSKLEGRRQQPPLTPREIQVVRLIAEGCATRRSPWRSASASRPPRST